jgi:Retrotransposon gag protein
MPPRRNVNRENLNKDEPDMRELIRAMTLQAQATARLVEEIQQGKTCPNASDQEIQKYTEFKKANPPVFHGDLDPDHATNWLMDLEQIFEDVQCTEEQKAKFASRMLKGEAFYWWQSQKPLLEQEGDEPITWEQFQAAFLEKYFPMDLRKEKEVEFLALT